MKETNFALKKDIRQLGYEASFSRLWKNSAASCDHLSKIALYSFKIHLTTVHLLLIQR